MAKITRKHIDHGETVVHDMRSQPSHRLHEVSVPWGSKPLEGYRWSHGWIDRKGFHWSLYTKQVPLREEDTPSLGERLGFQPIASRTHGYNGQEHR